MNDIDANICLCDQKLNGPSLTIFSEFIYELTDKVVHLA